MIGIIQMSTVERTRILDYLPPEEKQKVLTLVTRLKEETEAKQKFMGLYQQAQRQIDQLNRTCNLLKDQNKQLKQQMHNSFSMVSQLRAQFHQNHQKRTQLPVSTDHDWEDLPDEGDLQNKPDESNNATIVNYPPKIKVKSPLMKYRPPVMTDKKTISNLNVSTSQLCQTQLNSSRSQEIMDLRQQVRALQEQKRKKKQRDEEMKQKIKLIEEIKNRYRQGSQRSQRSEDENRVKEKSIEKIDINDSFDEHQAKTLYSHQKSLPNKSNQKSLKQVTKNKKKTDPKRVFQEKLPKEVKTSLAPTTGYIVTADDYSDVLDMINDSN